MKWYSRILFCRFAAQRNTVSFYTTPSFVNSPWFKEASSVPAVDFRCRLSQVTSPPQSSVCSTLFSYIPFTSSSLFKLSSLKLGLLLSAEFRLTKMRIQFSHFVSWCSSSEILLRLDAVQPSFPNSSSLLLFQLNSHLSSLHSDSHSPPFSSTLLTTHKNASRQLSNAKC